MSNSRRAAAVAALIDRKIRVMGGDCLAINACVAVGNAALNAGHSAWRSVELAVSTGTKIIDGGCHANG